ncbi:MAG: right-handed parallel beta-helix repeat-containing protein [Phycisphaerales bacterium]|nr:MAG: right-handed parallel beta-helix repeat-containing protein [Phycisphaerales bacterium]
MSKFSGAVLVSAALILCCQGGSTKGAAAAGAGQRTGELRDIIGVTHVAGKYHLTEGDFLNEGADAILELGSRVIKIWFADVKGSYPFNSDWPRMGSLVDIAKSPYFRRLFEKPFSTYIMMCFSVGRGGGYWKGGITEEQKRGEERQFYELAKHLLTTYNGTGKTFVLQHWEGDWLIRGNYDAKADPSPAAIKGMIGWLNARQAGVSRAREEVGQAGVRVYHAAEVNRVVDSMRTGRPNMVNRVLPHTNVDLVSYSAWDAATEHFEDPNVLREALDFIAANVADSRDFGGRNVYVGEFGMPENNFSGEKIRKAIPGAVRTALDWGCPYIVYWQLYCNELSGKEKRVPVKSNDGVRGFWLIRPDGSKAWTWDYFHGLLAGGKEVAGASFYVSPSGNDSWSGKLARPNRQRSDGPFRSLERARDAVRSLKRGGGLPAGGVSVYLRGGLYTIAETFELGAEDGGAEGRAVVYRAYGNEEVRLVGGRQIGGFGPVGEAAAKGRIAGQYRDKIVQVDLQKQGVKDFGEMTPRGFGRRTQAAGLELFFNDRPMRPARWPNGGWAKIAAVPAGAKGGKFTYEGDRPKRWGAGEDIWLHGYWTQDWADSYEKVKSIDFKSREIATHEPHGVYGYKAGQRYYALNILEELDEAGEWYLDRKSGMLYFWPPSAVEKGRVFVSILEGPMVSMREVSHVRMEGLIFECTRGPGVEIRGGSDNCVAGCTLRNIGNTAVNINGGKRNGVEGCVIHETGDGGIALVGGDRKTLTPAGNYARNNHIHDYSRWVRTYRAAIRASGVGNHVAHNLIHDAPHTGILFGGNDHLLEFNEIHDVCRETGDVGAFYTGRDWTTRGTVIRHNYFHDIRGPYTHGAMSVYLDDAASGTTIYGNVFYKASRAAFIGGGRDNVVENNIFVECEPAVHIDARGLGWAKKYAVRGGGWQMYDKLAAVNFDKPPYSTRYPKLARILEGDPAVPEGNVVRRNIRVGGRWMDLQGVDAKLVTMEDNLTEGDAYFVDAGGKNFQLRDDSPAYKLGFERIPIDQIGLLENDPN